MCSVGSSFKYKRKDKGQTTTRNLVDAGSKPESILYNFIARSDHFHAVEST